MPTVLFLIEWFAPAYKAGGPIQSISNLVSHQESGVDYKIVSSNRDLDRQVIAVKTDRWLNLNPWTKLYYSSKGINPRIWGRQTDILFINGIYSLHYNILPILFSGAKLKIVSGRGMLNLEAIAQKALKKKIFLTLWKWGGINRRVEFHAASREEEKAIKTIFGSHVTVHYAANFPRSFDLQPVREKKPGELHLVSVALISPMKNIRYVLQALQYVPETVHYHLYGPVKEPGYWKECLALVEELPPNIRVHYHGDLLPSKVEGALRNGHVFILPSKFENFCHAIYEALTAGKPVITSHNTPWNGLVAAKAGINVVPENGGQMADAIRSFAAMTEEELQQWSRGARAYAEAAIDLEEIKQQYRRMFRLKGRSAAVEAAQKTGGQHE